MALKRFGTEYSGFYYPQDLPDLNSESIIYCVGVGEDISHDLEVASKCGAPVWLFDPTPRSIEHVQLVREVLRSSQVPAPSPRFGGGDPDYWPRILRSGTDPELINFQPYALGVEDGEAEFYPPDNPEFVSHSLVMGMAGKLTTSALKVPVKTLRSIMEENKHDRIDFLKLDIEGVECEVLSAMLRHGITPAYVSVDFDMGRTGRAGRAMVELSIRRLLYLGYEILHAQEFDMSFRKTR